MRITAPCNRLPKRPWSDGVKYGTPIECDANEARSGPSKLDHTLRRGNSPSELEAFKMVSGQYVGPEK